MAEADIDIKIDGLLTEPVWLDIPYHGDLSVLEPDTLATPELESRVHYFYTKRGLYVGVWNEQDPASLISRLSSRDQFISRDGFSLTLDTSGRGLYAYWFGIELGGTMLDGTVLPERQYSNQWDGPWRGASAKVADGWSAEMFIPWSMMTMPQLTGDTREMGIYVSREVAYKNERWGTPALPRTQPTFLSRLKKVSLQGIEPKQQFTFYPYASSTWDNIPGEDSYKAGFDFFWRPSTNLQLTATVNPDFGNVESDNVVVNLTSFETFFPEKRPFFLEGQEIFVTTPRARQGRGSRGTPTTLVNTRRIGSPPKSPLVTNLELEAIVENQPSELEAAFKVTGQSGKFRYGSLVAIEDDTNLRGTVDDIATHVVQDGRNFGVARFLYEDATGGGRRSLGWISTVVAHPQEDAVTHGLDAHYLSTDGRYNVDLQVIASDVDDVTGAGGFIDFSYAPSQGRKHEIAFDYFDEDLDINDFGFLRRNDAIGARYSYEISESDLPDMKSRFTRFFATQEYNTDGKVVRSGLFSFRERLFENNSIFFTELNYFPKRWDDTNSDGNGSFKVHDRWQTGGFWENDQARKLSLSFGLFYTDEEIGGHSFEYESQFTWRPTDRFSLIFGLVYETRDGWLLHHKDRAFTTFDAAIWRPRIEGDFFISARQQFRVTAQWVGIKADEQDRWLVPAGDGELNRTTRIAGSKVRDFSISRLVFQARYRWEIAPLSDLFVVYTRGSDVPSDPSSHFDNLLSESWTNPAVDVLVVKLRYRLGS